jgi:hypothetical protein
MRSKTVVMNPYVRRCQLKGIYHPMGEYSRQRDLKLKQIIHPPKTFILMEEFGGLLYPVNTLYHFPSWNS